MRHISTVGLSAWLSIVPAALLSSHLAVAAPDSPATGASDAAPAAVPEASAPQTLPSQTTPPETLPPQTSAPQTSAPQAPAPQAAAQIAPEDAPIADALRVVTGDPLNKIVDQTKDREAIRAFYAARGYAPVWVRAAGPTERFRAAAARLNAADGDGLDAGDYPTPDAKSLAGGPEGLARAELTLTASMMAYARHAQSGQVTPSRISPNISVTPPVPEPTQVLATLAVADDVTAALDGFNPPHRGFQALRAKLQELRRSGATVAQPERRRGGQKTNHPASANQIDTVLANMERWRWLPRDLGASYVMVNVPDFSLDVMRDGRSVFHTKIVVGKKATPSPIFSDEIETVQVNPTWHVPESLIHGKYLPALSQDPSVLRRMGLIVSYGRDGSVSVRQPPGPKNALGRLKVNFPNQFQVYLHDTPDKHLFAHDTRAYSSGCMRVQNPDQFAAHVLSIGGSDRNYTPAALTGMYGSSERWINVKSHVPIHLVYMNAYVADTGKLVVRPDVYGYDARTQSALKGRYLVVNERSQRGSQVTRSARATRSAARGYGRERMVAGPTYEGYYDRSYDRRGGFGGFGGFWSWGSRGY